MVFYFGYVFAQFKSLSTYFSVVLILSLPVVTGFLVLSPISTRQELNVESRISGILLL